MESYLTLKPGSAAFGEFVDRKSRFIAQIRPIADEEAAEAFLAEARSEHYDARHHVPAWIFRDGWERCSDDGEPQRTAGMPVLDALKGAGLRDVCCIVVRYFGGTLLGPGGLVRAYTAATQAAIEAAEESGIVQEMTLVVPVEIVVPYARYDRVARMLQDFGGHVGDTAFAADVTIEASFKAGTEEPFLAALRELFGGEEPATAAAPRFAAF